MHRVQFLQHRLPRVLFLELKKRAAVSCDLTDAYLILRIRSTLQLLLLLDLLPHGVLPVRVGDAVRCHRRRTSSQAAGPMRDELLRAHVQRGGGRQQKQNEMRAAHGATASSLFWQL